MTNLESVKEAEVEVVLEHIRLELQTAIDDPSFMLRRLRPLVELAFIAGLEAGRNPYVKGQEDGAP